MFIALGWLRVYTKAEAPTTAIILDFSAFTLKRLLALGIVVIVIRSSSSRLLYNIDLVDTYSLVYLRTLINKVYNNTA